MIMYVSKNGYSVYVENSGDDVWVSVRHNGKRLYDCVVGCVGDNARNKDYINTAYQLFYPANYVSERLRSNDTRQRVYAVMQEACGIDHALEMAMSF